MSKPKRSDDEQFAAPPAPVAAADGPAPIGVPKGYTATRVAPKKFFGALVAPVQQRVAPQYFDGMEYQPSNWTVEEQAYLQMAMKSAGLYTAKEKFRLGTWDSNTRNAYRKLLEFANGTGASWQEALQEYGKARVGQEELDALEEEGRAPLSVKVSNPLDIRRVADAAARGAIGRKLRADELDRLVGAYQQLEAQEQTTAYGVSETGGTMTAAPDPQSFFTAEAEQIDPQGAAQMDALETGNEFFQLLTSERVG